VGLLNKIVLKFPRVWWPKESDSFHIYSADFKTPGHVWVLNQYKFHNKEPILVLHVSGPQAVELEQYSDTQITERIMDLLRKNFSEFIPDPTNSFSTRWKADPFTLGSYSVFFA
jgi:monoamine oxidase